MDFGQLDKVRSLVEVDHCYTSVNRRAGDNDEEILNLSSYHSTIKESCVDVGGPNTCLPAEETTNQDPSPTVGTTVPDLEQRIYVNQLEVDSYTWVPCEKRHLLKIMSSLKKIMRVEQVYSSQLSDTERLNCRKELCLRSAANNLRRIFADLSWHIEKCFSLHLWCIKNLSQTLLPFYRLVFYILWQKNKVNPLLKVLNTILQERCVNDVMVDRFLSDLEVTNSNDIKQTVSISRPIITKSLHQMSVIRSTSNDGIILACMTFPAPRDSKRLQKILYLLGEIGRVNLESQEEQICDSMRLRLRLFVRRVVGLLDECRNESVYLVGFGVGTLLMLLSAIHILSLDSRVDGNRTNVEGIICIGVPLVGLRGMRGGTNDPLLSIPSLPTLFIVGAGSRFGGYKEALEFRKRLRAARQSQVLSRNVVNSAHMDCSHMMNGYQVKHSVSESVHHDSTSPTFDLLAIGGADHLLRIRPSACKRWCTTQDKVDIRMVKAIKNFIYKTKVLTSERLSSSMDFMLPSLTSGGRS
ncbi:unnamed protein product [Heterobilharzia americana]|nr:unnamed protein product [Heterobilharzia americana]